MSGGDKVVSLCYLSQQGSQPTLQYRYGALNVAPELIYPAQPKYTLDDFAYFSQNNLQFFEFSRENTIYDVIIPTNAQHLNQADFIGIEVTIGQKRPTLLSCDTESAHINLNPIQTLLKISSDNNFSDALPKLDASSASYPIVTKKKKGKSSYLISYPVTKIPDFDRKISELVDTCRNFKGNKGNGCYAGVTLVGNNYLILKYQYSQMFGGMAIHM